MEGMHIMIVEDDQSLARELADFLSKWGYHVSTTKDFEDYNWEEKYRDSFFDINVDTSVKSSLLLTDT